MGIPQETIAMSRMTDSLCRKATGSVSTMPLRVSAPDLMERLAHHLGKFTEQQQQVCYLLSIGLTNTQIENLTDIPHVTVWRWVKKMEWVQGDK